MTISVQKSALTKSTFKTFSKQLCTKILALNAFTDKRESCEPSWSSSSYILNSIRQSSGLRWTKVCLLYCISRMQHLIELTSNCMSFLTRHQRNEWTIRNSYLMTIRSSRMSFKSLWVVNEKQAAERWLHILKMNKSAVKYAAEFQWVAA
jgi:hypothetical protein